MATIGLARTRNSFVPGHFKNDEHGIWPQMRGFVWMARSFLVVALSSVLAFFPAATRLMAATPTYQAEVSAASTTIPAGTSQQITLKFKNIGTQSWIGDRAHTAVYLYGNSSVFGHPTWPADDVPGMVSPTIIHPGDMATATFWVKAPSTPGTYSERFLLSSGPNAWIKGSTVTVTFRVTGSSGGPAVVASPIITGQAAAQSSATNLDATQWKAELADKGGIEWQLDPGGHTIINLAFKNRGTRTWAKEGGSPLMLVTSGLRQSPFKDFSWKTTAQTALLSDAIVRPGGIGHFTLELRAPEVPGVYRESFELALAGSQILPGSLVTLPITVSVPQNYISKGITSTNGSVTAANSAQIGFYKTVLMLSSAKTVSLSGNGRLSLTFGFKNAGTATWNSLSLRVAGVVPALTGTLSSVRDSSWVSGIVPVKADAVTAPGQIGFLGFTIKAPAKRGNYTASFQLYADDQAVQDGQIEIPITVTSDGATENIVAPTPVPPTSIPVTPTSPVVAPVDLASLPSEPLIRVGLFATTDDKMVVQAVNGGFSLQQNGSRVCHFTDGQSVTVTYDRSAGISRAVGPDCTTQSTGVYVAVADDGISPLELTDFSRPVSWLPGANDNKFRGKLELRYTPATKNVWIINELPIEWYLKGIGETSNSSPMEYQKALLTAARTYAMYHVQHASKHADENYIVDAKYDQVYRGYGAEIRDPAVVAAVDATRGQIVTYGGVLAITPYYSRSDGRTRAWTEVWGGSGKPWLVSVAVSWDQGRTLWGHGVGMSATGALGAAADGWLYDHILNYFYQGTGLTRIYQ